LMACLALATSPPLVIWTASGLENGLLLSLVALLWALLILRPGHWPALSGVVAGLIGMARPDGLVFGGVAPAMLLLETWTSRERRSGWLRALVRHLAGFAAVVVPFLAFRLVYFALPWPHPYYAKREWSSAGVRLSDLLKHPKAALVKLWGLAVGVAGPVAVWLLLGLLAAALLLVLRGRLPRHVGVTMLVGAFGIGAYLWLESDWMGEYRFATPVVAMGLIFVFAMLHATVPDESHTLLARARLAVSWGVVAVLVLDFAPRLYRFALSPPTAYAEVSRLYAQRFNAMAKALGVQHGSILIADTGAMLMESRLTVYDVAGLFEPAVVQKLKKGTPVWWYDHPAFNDWVLDAIKPSFIVAYKFWTNVTGFERDPRFLRDYVAIEAFKDPYVARVYRRDLHSGEFVRRELLSGAVGLGQLQHDFQPAAAPRPVAYRLADLLRSLRHRSETVSEIKAEALALLRDDREPSGPSQATDLLQTVLARSPDDREALRALAGAFDDSGRAAEARPVWERLLAVAGRERDERAVLAAVARLAPFPGVAEVAVAHGTSGAVTPEGLLKLSQEQYRERRFLEVIEACQAAIRLRPGYAEAYNNICAAYNELGRWDEAIEACSKAIELKPDLQLARNNLAWAKQEKSRIPR